MYAERLKPKSGSLYEQFREAIAASGAPIVDVRYDLGEDWEGRPLINIYYLVPDESPETLAALKVNNTWRMELDVIDWLYTHVFDPDRVVGVWGRYMTQATYRAMARNYSGNGDDASGPLINIATQE